MPNQFGEDFFRAQFILLSCFCTRPMRQAAAAAMMNAEQHSHFLFGLFIVRA
jgi:hypothetical protein